MCLSDNGDYSHSNAAVLSEFTNFVIVACLHNLKNHENLENPSILMSMCDEDGAFEISRIILLIAYTIFKLFSLRR